MIKLQIPRMFNVRCFCKVIMILILDLTFRRFGTTYVGSNQVGPQETYPILFGDIDSSGNLNAHVLHQLGRVRGKLMTQISRNKFNAVQMTADYKGESYTLSTTLANPDILNGSGGFLNNHLFIYDVIDSKTKFQCFSR